jgi:hypothetical protein
MVGRGAMLQAGPDGVAAFSIERVLTAALLPLISTQPPTAMNTRNLPKVKGRPARKADYFSAIREPIVSQPYWSLRPVTEIAVSFMNL